MVWLNQWGKVLINLEEHRCAPGEMIVDLLIYSSLTFICSRFGYDRHRYFTLKPSWLLEGRYSVLAHRVSEAPSKTPKILTVNMHILALRRSFELLSSALLFHRA